MSEFTEEQEELLGKPVITILPAFNNEWVIEVRTHDDVLCGRFNAESPEVAVHAVQKALEPDNLPPYSEFN